MYCPLSKSVCELLMSINLHIYIICMICDIYSVDSIFVCIHTSYIEYCFIHCIEWLQSTLCSLF